MYILEIIGPKTKFHNRGLVRRIGIRLHQQIFFGMGQRVKGPVEESSESPECDNLVDIQLLKQALKKAEKLAALTARGKAYIPPVQEESAARRNAGYQIMKNKGLTRKRKKEVRNSRVKYRNKFEKAVMRRKGQVQDTIREGPSDGVTYTGEESGVRTHVKKSIRLT